MGFLIFLFIIGAVGVLIVVIGIALGLWDKVYYGDDDFKDEMLDRMDRLEDRYDRW